MIPTIFFYVVLILILLVVASGVLLFLGRRQRLKKNLTRSLSMVVLKIDPPPFSEDVKGDNRDARSVLEENIAKATTLYNLLASTAEKETLKIKYYRQPHIGFELVASANDVSLYTVVPLSLVAMVRQAIVSAYRGALVEEVTDHNLFPPEFKSGNVVGGHLQLRRNYAYPLATYLESHVDIMKVILEAMAHLKAEDRAGLQILIRPASQQWTKEPQAVAKKLRQGKENASFFKELALGAVRPPSEDKKDLKPDPVSQLDQKLSEAIEKKITQPGFEVFVRLMVAAEDINRSRVVYNNLLSAFQLMDAPKSNGFLAVVSKNTQQLLEDFNLYSFPQKYTMNILSADELATLFHLPNQDNMPTSQLKRLDTKQVDGPRNFPEDGLLLGHNVFRNQKRLVRLGDEDRMRHMYVIGQTGTGKSVFLENLVLQDLQAGRGLAFIDPHGETAERILSLIPEDRLGDVIYFNPGNLEFPMGLNIFEHDEADKQDNLIQEAILMLYKLYDPQKQGIIGPRYEYMFRNAAKLIMADPAGGTFIDIPKLFNDRAFVNQKLRYVTDQSVLDFWQKEIVDAARSSEAGDVKSWFVSKFSAFLSNTMMRNIIGQTKSSFKLREIMDDGKIMIVNLSQGLTGELNMKLLGMLFVTKFQRAAMSRADVPSAQRRDFTLYIDEFQDFATDSFAVILSAARKYRFSLVMANQHMAQLSEEIREAIYGNVGTIVSFRISAQDAEHMVKQFYSQNFEISDLTRLPLGHSLVRTLVDGAPTTPFNMNTLPPSALDPARQQQVEQQLLKRHGRPRQEVEAEISKRLSAPSPPTMKEAQAILDNLKSRPKRPTPGLFTDNWLKHKAALEQKMKKQRQMLDDEMAKQEELSKRADQGHRELQKMQEVDDDKDERTQKNLPPTE